MIEQWGGGTRLIRNERKGVYTRKRGLDRATNKELLLKHVKENAEDGSRLRDFLQVLPGLTRRQVQKLINEIREEGLVYCTGKTRATLWFPGPGEQEVQKGE